ncbi:MAG: hypothetical protein J6S01_03420 [Bacteroidales bacterium]|nr:hypothetical protein [Bacteroidales bacterium]MBO5979410.1 hypothetical protein [Bacteroidales bacterium]
METPFVYDKYITGKYFLGRKKECSVMANLLAAREHVSLYEPPKTGKMSLIRQTLINMRSNGVQFVAPFVDMLSVRTLSDFLLAFGTSVLKASASTPEEFSRIVKIHLADTHFVFDHMRYSMDEELVSLNWAPDLNDVEKMMRLPVEMAKEKKVPYIVILNEFHNILNAAEGEKVLKILEAQFALREEPYTATFVMSGGMVNAMKYIFEEKRFFYRQANHIALSNVDEREIVEHVVKGFLNMTGKSFDRNLAMGACELFRSNLWYVNHLAAICDALSKGFVTEAMMTEALNSMISVHEPRFISIVNDLTDHQLSLLRAVLDGVVKFSASDVIEKYHLNSSANVRRVKDALKKKEVLTFNEKDEPVILDPLFEYWVSTFYFKIKR